jgi:hypothetical protein
MFQNAGRGGTRLPCAQRNTNASLRRFSVNTLKVFLGAGILTMPFGMKQVAVIAS